jgi:hypothetical protein
MSAKDFILKNTRAEFDKWNRTRYYNRTLQTDAVAWEAWKAAIVNYLQTELDDDPDLSDKCSITLSRSAAKLEIRTLRGSTI